MASAPSPATIAVFVLLCATCLVGGNVWRWRTRLIGGRWVLPMESTLANIDEVGENLREHLSTLVTMVQGVGQPLADDPRLSAPDHGQQQVANIADTKSKDAPAESVGLPSFAELFRRRPKPGANTDVWRAAPREEFEASEVATLLTDAVRYVERLTSEWQENVTYAINTADKLKYQLDNLEPVTHHLSKPQWNPVRVSDQPPGETPRFFMIGISSVNRRENYLASTLRAFIDALDPGERQAVKIVVFNAHVPPSAHEDIPIVMTQFQEHIESGMLQIIQRPDGDKPHPQMADPSKLTLRWGDDVKRVTWRSKQVLDVAYLMDFCVKNRQHHEYFLMMEDDIIASQQYARKIRKWVDNTLYKRTDWMMASFYNPWEDVRDQQLLEPFKFFGVIGQLFRMHDLPVVVEFLQKNFDQSPLDWLFVDFLKKFKGHLIQHTPSYFQHQGKVSSLEGKQQDGRSVDFQP